MKADLFRALVLFFVGGVYADRCVYIGGFHISLLGWRIEVMVKLIVDCVVTV